MVIIGDLAYETTIIENKRHTCLGGSGYYAAIGAKAAQNDNFIMGIYILLMRKKTDYCLI